MEGEREGETRGEKKGRRFPVPGTDGRGRSARTGAADRQRGGGGCSAGWPAGRGAVPGGGGWEVGERAAAP
jgi:hypothetical protein